MLRTHFLFIVLLLFAFQAFLDRSVTIVERALAIGDSGFAFDLTVDYGAVQELAWTDATKKHDLLTPLVCVLAPCWCPRSNVAGAFLLIAQ